MLSKQVGAIYRSKISYDKPNRKGADNEAEVAADEVDLGDKEHVRDDGTTSPNKSLSSINGYVGVSFYFGAPKTMVKSNYCYIYLRPSLYKREGLTGFVIDTQLNMKGFFIFFYLIFTFCNLTFAQYKLSGTVKDA